MKLFAAAFLSLLTLCVAQQSQANGQDLYKAFEGGVLPKDYQLGVAVKYVGESGIYSPTRISCFIFDVNGNHIPATYLVFQFQKPNEKTYTGLLSYGISEQIDSTIEFHTYENKELVGINKDGTTIFLRSLENRSGLIAKVNDKNQKTAQYLSCLSAQY